MIALDDDEEEKELPAAGPSRLFPFEMMKPVQDPLAEI